jgi:2-dehydro-3-deoxygalactonokinase
MSALPEWIAVDWGTSNLRVWGMSGDDAVVASASSDEGMGKLAPEAFAGVLTGLVAQHVADPARPLDVVVCGMAGARQGWLEAPYMDVPANLGDLGRRAVRPPMPGTALAPHILPGLCRTGPGEEDVMRGEETQLLGFAHLNPGYRGLVCMPGTHSKWATIEGTSVTGFATAMTGELFEVLSTHTVLRHSIGETKTEMDIGGFDAGLRQATDNPELLTSLLFKVRAAALLSGRGPAWCAGYLSGLLIGSEIAGHRAMLRSEPIPLIGSSSLARLYARGFETLGARTRTIDATAATLAGLTAARHQMKGHTSWKTDN